MFNLYLLKFSVQFVTPISLFTPFESNGLVYKPHPRFFTQNFGKKVRLIHEFLRYFNTVSHTILLFELIMQIKHVNCQN